VAAAVATMPPGSPAALPTTVAMTVVSALAAAVLFGLIGAFRLAELVRYVPYPVIGGFLAGTGWLLGPFPAGSLWRPPTLETVEPADWALIADNAGTLAILLVIALLALLLNLTGMELATGRDIDVNRELRVTAAANVLSGLGGGPVGYHALSLSALSHRLSSRGRLTSLVVVLAFVGALVGGAPALALVPTPVPGAVLLFLGLDFLAVST
jgi:SulP family sulfate permease